MIDLVACLQAAASAAIASREAAIASGEGRLRSVHIEIEVANDGDVLDTTTWLEWRKTIRRTAG